MTPAPMPFIPKHDHDLPDWYGISVTYVNGKVETFEVASHTFIQTVSAFNGDGSIREKSNLYVIELATRNDEYVCIPFSSVLKLSFDKQYSKVVACRQKQKGILQ